MYPLLFHVLYDRELVRDFGTIDDAANKEKKFTHRAGLWAVGAGTSCLLVTALGPIWYHDEHGFAPVLTAIAAALGLAAALIGGFGLMVGSRKQRWLLQRLRTERLRQLHFQAFLWQLNEIQASLAEGSPPDSPQAVEARAIFEHKRQHWRQTLLNQLERQEEAELEKVISDEMACGSDTVWLHPRSDGVSALRRFSPAAKTELFKAYSEWRIGWQATYGIIKSRKDGHLVKTLKFIERFWSFFFCALLVLHVVVLVGLVAGWSWVALPGYHAVILATAVLAIALQKVKEGLRLEEELARYREYRIEMGELSRRFEQAADDDERFDVMMETERKSYAEMRQFLRSHHEATFVL